MRRVAVVGAVVGVAVVSSVARLAPIASAGGDQLNFEVTKVVHGTSSSGFTVHYACTDDPINSEGDIEFDATGTPTTSNSVLINNDGSCTITEPGNGGADKTGFACDTDGNSECTAGNVITWDGIDPSHVNIVVTNAFSNALDPPTVDPSTATPGEQVTVSGTDCTNALAGGAPDAAPVDVTVAFPTPLVLHATPTSTGAWSVPFTVPTGVSGTFAVDAVCGDPVPYPSVTLTVPAAPTVPGSAGGGPAQAILGTVTFTG